MAHPLEAPALKVIERMKRTQVDVDSAHRQIDEVMDALYDLYPEAFELGRPDAGARLE